MSKNVLSTVPPTSAATGAEPTAPTSSAIAAVAQVLALSRQSHEVLAPHYQALAEDDRATLPPVPNLFFEAAPTMLEALRPKTALVAVVPNFDLDQVQDQVAQILALRALENDIEQLLGTVHDSVRALEADLYTRLLPVYRTAKTLAKQDPSLRGVVSPMQKVYAARRPARKSSE